MNEGLAILGGVNAPNAMPPAAILFVLPVFGGLVVWVLASLLGFARWKLPARPAIALGLSASVLALVTAATVLALWPHYTPFTPQCLGMIPGFSYTTVVFWRHRRRER
jgi:CHASE2 domain-containing sensor protein